MNRSIFFAIIAMALVSVFSSIRIAAALDEKTMTQERATNSVLNWNRAVLALAKSEDQWLEALPAAKGFADLASLIDRTDPAPLVWPNVEKIAIDSIKPLEHLHAYKACLNDGGGGVMFSVDTVEQAFFSIDMLSERKNVMFDGISIMPAKRGVYVRFAKFCLLMRG